MKRRFLACILLLSLCANAVRADDARERCVAGLDAERTHTLLARVERDLIEHQRGARMWFWGWFATYAGFAVGSSALLFTPGLDPAWRDGYIWGAASSGAALLGLLLPPLPAIGARRRIGPAAPGNERERLVRALTVLEDSAAQERFLRSGWAQTANVAVATADGLYLGLRYPHRLEVTLPNAIGSFAVGETQILTTPRAAARLEEALEREGAPCVGQNTRPSPAKTSLRWLVSPTSVGAVLRF